MSTVRCNKMVGLWGKMVRADLLTLALAGLLVLPGAAWGQPGKTAGVPKALLAQQWKVLADDLLGSVSDDPKQSPDPVLRWIKGLACVPLNRNNEAVRMFYSVANTEDLGKCEAWAKELLSAGREAPVALYCYADILARHWKRQEAIEVCDKALALAGREGGPEAGIPLRALLCNARGVLYLRTDKLPEAMSDLNAAATAAKGRLADAYANLGAYQIQKRGDPETGIKCYTEALRLSKNFSLAYYNRACLRLIRGPRKGESEKAFKDAVADDLKNAFRYGGPERALMLEALPSPQADSKAKVAVTEEAGSAFATQFNTFFKQQGSSNWVPGAHSTALRDMGKQFAVLSPAQQKSALTAIRAEMGNTPKANEYMRVIQTTAGGLAVSPDRTTIVGGFAKGGLVFGATQDKLPSGVRDQLFQTGAAKGAGGIVVTFEGSVSDLGDWPFVPAFGLLY